MMTLTFATSDGEVLSIRCPISAIALNLVCRLIATDSFGSEMIKASSGSARLLDEGGFSITPALSLTVSFEESETVTE